MRTSTTHPFHFSELTVNGAIIAIVAREAIRRAGVQIQFYRNEFDVHEKEEVVPGKPNFFTNADTAAQKEIAQVLQEAFPEIGIIGEEGLNVPCTLEGDTKLFWTIDPLDGTNAFIRRQGTGVGIMIALVAVYPDGSRRVICAYIGDAMNGDVIGFRPGSEKVHHIPKMMKGRRLIINTDRPLSDQYALLNARPEEFSPIFGRLFRRKSDGGLFKDIEKTNGSIGLMANRLANAEVGAFAFPPNNQTPWDTSPVIGILGHMGFVFLSYDAHSREFTPSHELREPPLVTSRTTQDILIVHSSRVEELKQWCINEVFENG